MFVIAAPTASGVAHAAVQSGGGDAAVANTPVATADAAAADAIVALQAEVLVLVELDGFSSVPPALAAVHEEWREYTDGFTRDGLVQWLCEVDEDGSVALDRLIVTGARPGPAMMVALGRLGSEDRLAVESGGVVAVAPGEYAAALGNLEGNYDGETSIVVTSNPPAAVPVGTRADVVRSDDGGTLGSIGGVGADTPASASAVDYPWFAVTMALVGVFAVGSLMVLLGRRRDGSPGTNAVFDQLLDAGRRMTSALDRREIAGIAVGEATLLGHARLGAFVNVRADGLSLAHQTGELIDERTIADGLLSRVAATGRAIRIVSNDEPALTALPSALLAVPVIGRGSVTGIVLLVRPDDAPFTAEEEEIVGRLAPMIGSALSAADIHGDIAELTRTDALTGLANRRCLDADLAAELMRLGDGSTLSLVMIDVDHFKHFNDMNGHAAGDQALCAVADALRGAVRTGDVAYRYGGEEFSLLLRGVSVETATEVAERARRAVESIVVVGSDLQPGGRLTVSLGINVVSDGDVDAVIGSADGALYEAKAQGRNRIVVSGDHVPIG